MKKIILITFITFLSLNVFTLTSPAKDKIDNTKNTDNSANAIDNNSVPHGSEWNDDIPPGDRPDDILNNHDPINCNPADDLDGGMPSITPWSDF